MQHNYIQTPYVLEAVLPIVVFGHYTNVWSLNYIVRKQTITNIHTKKAIPTYTQKKQYLQQVFHNPLGKIPDNKHKEIDIDFKVPKKKATANYNVRKCSEYKQ